MVPLDLLKIRLPHIIIPIILFSCISCKKPFSANLTGDAVNFLTVDGTIISGDSTFITLGRTTGLKDTTQFKPELKAVVSVQNDQNVFYPLVEKGKGVYVLGVTNFDQARTYRLNIKTTDGKIYQSDYVPMKITPPIDSVYFQQPDENTMLFYVDTHDASNNTRYYRWDYKETWEYIAILGGVDAYQYNANNNTLIARNPPISTTYCYGSAPSNEILIGSSANLAKDIITKQQIGAIVGQSQKIERIYNMELHQYAITADAFKYYQNLKLNTEQLGSIFDAQPSTTNGNIHCITSPADLVTGFINVSTVTTRLLVLKYNDIPLRNVDYYFTNGFYYIGPPDFDECEAPDPNIFGGNGFGGILLLEPAGTFNDRLAALVTGQTVKFPILFNGLASSSVNGVITPLGYTYIKRDCADCRVINHAGTSVSTIVPFGFKFF